MSRAITSRRLARLRETIPAEHRDFADGVASLLVAALLRDIENRKLPVPTLAKPKTGRTRRGSR